ncbi:hypothetical protein D3C78_1463890 [compost metagenome]
MHRQAHRQWIGIAHTFCCCGVYAVFHPSPEHGATDDGLSYHDVVPGQHLAGFVKADTSTVQVHGAVIPAFDIVLAAP